MNCTSAAAQYGDITSACDSTGLPFTGAHLGLIIAIGVILIVLGVVLRWRASR